LQNLQIILGPGDNDGCPPLLSAAFCENPRPPVLLLPPPVVLPPDAPAQCCVSMSTRQIGQRLFNDSH
jgi:hypothetical protein